MKGEKEERGGLERVGNRDQSDWLLRRIGKELVCTGWLTRETRADAKKRG